MSDSNIQKSRRNEWICLGVCIEKGAFLYIKHGIFPCIGEH
jgi:hypothetical protein